MFLQTYGVAVAIILASLVIGRAICGLSGIPERPWAAPMVGFAALIIIAEATIQLPGRAVTANVLGLLVLGAGLAYLLLRRRWPISPAGLGVVVLALLVVSIPFWAAGRIGLPGVSLDNDTSAHLVWAETRRSPHMASLWGVAGGYPLGPHSLVAALGTLFRVPLDAVLTGFLIAIAPLTALTGMGVLANQATWRRMVTGLFCGLVFLVSGYYGEGAFKETAMAGLLLAFVVHLEQVRRSWTGLADARQWLRLLPAAVITAGSIYTYSYVAIGWVLATLGIWALAEIVARPARAFRWASKRNLLLAARPLSIAALVLLVLLLPIAGQILTFFHGLGATPTSLPAPLGNLSGPLSPYEMFGISLNPDFRYVLDNFHAGEVAAFSIAVVLYGFMWSLWRRDLLLPAAAGAAMFLWWVAHRGPSPYVTAKALVIASPVLMAVTLKALLSRTPGDWRTGLLRFLVAVAFCGLAAYTTLRTLRDSPVQAPAPGQNLEAFHHVIGRSRVLFLGDDDYAGWFLRDAAVGDPTGVSALGVPASTRPEKPAGPPGQPVDFDSVPSAELNLFQFVVTSSSPYNSEPYPNFQLVAKGRFYELWRRTGATVPRQVLEPPGSPGAILNCHTAQGRRLQAAPGMASVVPSAPLLFHGASLSAGGVATIALRLPPGRWELSLQYFSDFNVGFTAPGLQVTMPAYLGRLGPFFSLGSVTGRGRKKPEVLIASVQRPSFLTSSFDNLFTEFPTIAATRLPDTRQVVPLRQACGKYVDWYRLK